ncbi:hypothetical protein MIMGU_mgv1a023938mg [Erythranthe guttata]|uniref:ENTH domain-containing protein n=1 Tax=Erythranthe guttata TaxID=4155 RepID=A0A022R6V9_ERYGU|nr:PREDICTED: putative clathrin assembly protein At1g03050 [Erythranthe guttata]EYU35413.1 hypothetical protein MIMGU_mgv1a023938mg [Erythranthe guttata]|eukprot:XP_012839775.1 PREDICTED: putative clathrin assembly protein At1g03050 [Erythranthe guttata]
MAPSKIRKAIGAVKDHTSIGLAKFAGGSRSISALDVAVVKATRHQEYPPDDKYVSQIITLTSHSRAHVNACIRTIAKRLNKTKNWVVALKTLMLVHRLLSDDVAEDQRHRLHAAVYEREISCYLTRRGARLLLDVSGFRDASGKTDAWDHSSFVRAYAAYLDERLELRMQGQNGKHGGYSSYHEDEEEDGGGGGGGAAKGTGDIPTSEMKNETVFSRVQNLMKLLERFLACRPAGAAKHNRVVAVALHHIVKESFELYTDITEITAVLTERFMQLEIPDMVRVYEIFCHLSKQYEELDAFYEWGRTVGIMRFSDYPYIEKITQKKLDMMDDFIHQKSAMSKNRMRASTAEPKPKPKPKPKPIEEKKEAEPQEDLFAIKALPPPERFEDEKTDEVKNQKITQEVGDLLNLSEDAPSHAEEGQKMALALFDCGSKSTTTTTTTNTPPWEAFKDSSGDWETALVHSVSHLSNQKASLPGGFDTLILDGMYKHGEMAAAYSKDCSANGSASSVAVRSAVGPTVLALPPPNGGGADPFAASVGIAPPSYVQMPEMERKQRLLVQEQQLWQQYARNGMQGHVGLSKMQNGVTYPYNAEVYSTRIW